MRLSLLPITIRHIITIGLVSSSISAMAATTPLISSEPLPTVKLDAITVYGETYRTTATKTTLPPSQAPMSYHRIEQNTLKQRQADSVSSALRYEAGVDTENRGTVSIFDEYNIRGFKNYSNFYDGMRLPYDGTWNLMPQVDAYATEAIEILKGPASSLYGFNQPGGMVNQVAKTPKSSPQHEIRLRTGTHNLKEVGIDSTSKLSDDINYRMVALVRKKDGQMQDTKEKRTLINPSLIWRPNDDISVLASIYYQNDPNMLPSTPLPSLGTLYNASYGKLGANAYAGDHWNHFSKKVFMPSQTINWQINDALKFKHILRHTNAKAQQKNTYHQGFVQGSDSKLNRTAYTTDENMTNWSTDNQLAYDLFIKDSSHNLLLGVDYQKTNSTAKYADAMYQGVPTIDLAQPDHGLFSKANLNLTGYQQQDDIKQKQLGVYLQDEMQWNNLTVVAGLRRDNYESVTNTQTANNTHKTTINQANKTSGRLAGIYHFNHGFSPYASYSQSFQPLVGNNFVTNKPFEPTTANQFEVGVKYASTDNKTKASLAAFDITKKNEKVATVDWTKQTQTGETTSKGFEISADHRFNDWLHAGLSYGYVDAKISKDEFNPQLVGNRPQQVAKHTASLWTTLTPNDKTLLNVGIRHQAGMQVDRQNSDVLPSVTLVDLAGSHQISPTLSAGLSVSNLFNKTYVGSCYDKMNCWMGAERQASVSLTANF